MPIADDFCPDCRARLVTDLSRLPWCPSCRWNLGVLEAGPGTPSGPVARLAHRIAYKRTMSVFDRLREHGGMPAASRSRFFLQALSAILAAATVALAALGIWLCVRGFPNWSIVPGLICLVVAWFLGPRGGRLDEFAPVVERSEAPSLHDLVDRVTTATGTRRPHLVVLDIRFNASAGITGLLRRRRVLTLGAPLWMSLSAQERVAVLGHELGHFRHRDAARSLATQPALTTFGRLADVLRPELPTGRHPSLLDRIVLLLTLPLYLALRMADIGVYTVATRGFQREEYRADAVAARVAGKRAMVSLLDKLVHADGLRTVAASKARARLFTPEEVRTAADEALRRNASRVRDRRQWTVKEVSLYDTHPPNGLRAELVEAGLDSPAEVVCTEAESARIDAELATRYAKARYDVAHID